MSKLLEYLHENKIDQIPDDQEFVEAEYDAVMEYCIERNFNISDEDMKTIISRALEDSFYNCKEYYVKDLWMEFGDIPMNSETECIEEDWREFPAGTHREEIWHWFEETFGISVAEDLMGL